MTFVNPSFSNHALLFCPLPPPPQCVIIALSFSNVCKISTAFAPRKRFSVLSNGTFRAFGRFSQRLRSLRLGISRAYTPAEFIGRFDLKKSGFRFARGSEAFLRSRPRLWFPRVFLVRRRRWWCRCCRFPPLLEKSPYFFFFGETAKKKEEALSKSSVTKMISCSRVGKARLTRG